MFAFARDLYCIFLHGFGFFCMILNDRHFCFPVLIPINFDKNMWKILKKMIFVKKDERKIYFGIFNPHD